MGYNCQDMRAANLLMGSHPNVLVMTLIVAGIDRVLHGLLGWILKVISCLRGLRAFQVLHVGDRMVLWTSFYFVVV